jgi:nucleoside-diphosphate-sugar epimerase
VAWGAVYLVYIDDVVDARLLAAFRLQNQDVQSIENYFVSSNHPIKLKELVKLYENIIGKLKLIFNINRQYSRCGEPYHK